MSHIQDEETYPLYCIDDYIACAVNPAKTRKRYIDAVLKALDCGPTNERTKRKAQVNSRYHFTDAELAICAKILSGLTGLNIAATDLYYSTKKPQVA